MIFPENNFLSIFVHNHVYSFIYQKLSAENTKNKLILITKPMASTFAKRFNFLPCASTAQVKSVFKASNTNYVPKYEPPIPTEMTFVNGLFVAPVHEPLKNIKKFICIFKDNSVYCCFFLKNLTQN
jgi:hypothetical protein